MLSRRRSSWPSSRPFPLRRRGTLTSMDFIGFTQCALLFSVPLLIARGDSRRDFAAILLDVRNLPKLAAVFLVGVSGLALFDIGLSSAHPIITAAILNLTPFWAALVAFIVSKRSVSVSRAVFFGCFLVAFCGAMTIAWSQINADNKILANDVIESAIHSKWIYALPAPIFFALSGTLVFKWFSKFDKSAAIAANFVVSSLVLIPVAVATSNFGARAERTVRAPHFAVAFRHAGVLRRRAGLLSNCPDGDAKRQRLRDDVFLADSGADPADLLPAVAVDTGLAVRRRAAFLHRDGAGDGPAFLVFTDNLARRTGASRLKRYRCGSRGALRAERPHSTVVRLTPTVATGTELRAAQQAAKRFSAGPPFALL